VNVEGLIAKIVRMTTKKTFKFSPEQKKLYDACTKLERLTVINHIQGNMSQRAAYYEAGGKSKTHKSADANVSRMLGTERVKAFSDSLVEEMAGTSIMTRQEAREILSDIGRTRITDIIDFQNIETGKDEEGKGLRQSIWNIKDGKDIKPEHARCISEVSAGKDGLKIKTHSAPAAIKQLAIMEGWESAQKHEHSGPDGKPIETKSTSDEDLARKIAFLLTKGDSK